VLDLWPARILAILGNSLGTLAVVAVALRTFRSRPFGNLLILAGIAVAGIGSGLAGLGVGALAPAIVVAALLLYAGFVAPTTFPKPHRPEHRDHEHNEQGLDDRAGKPSVGH
jgi:fatty acid desaturase